jgi:phosphoglycolate phosphatase-like HAD superfamily hydrolase
MITIALDADGTIWDCSKEWYDTAVETWKSVEGRDFPIGTKDFKKYIWSVVRPEHFMQNAKLVERGIKLPNNFDELQKLRNQFNVSRHVDAFYKTRTRLMQEKEEWMAKHKLYSGIRPMFDCLEDLDVNNVVVTSKDELSTRELLKHFDIEKYIKEVYSKEVGSRKEQFGRLLRNHEKCAINYDDMPQNLKIAKDFGLLPVAAPQGYSRLTDLSGYIIATPTEFVEIVMETIK